MGVGGRESRATRRARDDGSRRVSLVVRFGVLSLLLITDVLTFEQQIGPQVVAILIIFAWLLLVNLVAHRTRALPRSVTRIGVLTGVALFTGLVLVAAGFVLPGLVGQLASWLGYVLGGLAWLALPVYVLLLATRVFSRSAPPGVPAPAEPVQGVRS